MAMLVTDPVLEEEIRAQRELTGADRFDEVWEGVYIMAPLANDEHQGLQLQFCFILQATVGAVGALVRAGVNVSDRVVDWKQNYRCPDVVVFLPGTKARNCDTHWLGGPDFAIEIVSPLDKSREKIPFYEKVGVRELLIVDRDPWRIELLRLRSGTLGSVGFSTGDHPLKLASKIVPLAFELRQGSPRPQIIVSHREGSQKWVI